MQLTAADVMNRDVTVFRSDTNLLDALAVIAENAFSGAPVVDDDNLLIGIVTEQDLLTCIDLERDLSPQLDRAIPVTQDAIAVDAETTIEALRQYFVEFGFKRFPVVDQQRRIIGVVSRRDLVQYIAGHAKAIGR